MATFNKQRSADLRARRMRRAGLEPLPEAYDLHRWREVWEACGVPLLRAATHAPADPVWKGCPLEYRTWIPAEWVELLPALARCTDAERGTLVQWCAKDREFLDSLRVQLRLAAGRGEDAVDVLRDIGWARVTEREVAVFPRGHYTNRGRTFSGQQSLPSMWIR